MFARHARAQTPVRQVLSHSANRGLAPVDVLHAAHHAQVGSERAQPSAGQVLGARSHTYSS